ncbi:unnamed protein product [Closterium sp. NIES-54]
MYSCGRCAACEQGDSSTEPYIVAHHYPVFPYTPLPPSQGYGYGYGYGTRPLLQPFFLRARGLVHRALHRLSPHHARPCCCCPLRSHYPTSLRAMAMAPWRQGAAPIALPANKATRPLSLIMSLTTSCSPMLLLWPSIGGDTATNGLPAGGMGRRGRRRRKGTAEEGA